MATAIARQNKSVVGEFLRRKIATGIQLEYIDLFSLDANQSTSIIDTWAIGGNEQNDIAVQEIVEQVKLEAQNFADVIGGNQTFMITVRGEHDFVANTYFKMIGLRAEDGIGSEPANQKGVLAQLMRHNQQLMSMNNMAMSQAFRHLTSMNERLSDRNETLEQHRIDMYDVLEDLTTRKHEREIEANTAIENSELKRKAFEQFLPLLPLVLNKIAGVEGGGDSAMGNTLLTFFESLDDKQRQEIQDSLSQEQQIVLMSLWQEVASKGEENE